MKGPTHFWASAPASPGMPADMKYTCPQDPEVRLKGPGACPKMGWHSNPRPRADHKGRVDVPVAIREWWASATTSFLRGGNRGHALAYGTSSTHLRAASMVQYETAPAERHRLLLRRAPRKQRTHNRTRAWPILGDRSVSAYELSLK